MCGSGASSNTTSGSLPPSGKVASLLIRNWGVVLVPALKRVEIPGNPGILGLGTVAATPSMVLLMWT